MIVPVPDYATPLEGHRADMAHMHGYGPACIPAYGFDGELFHAKPNYGRYIPIDLDENNRASRAAWAERNGYEPPSFGWGVCRHGFGLQGDVGRRGQGMSREEAERVAIECNAAIRIGADPRPQAQIDAHDYLRAVRAR